MTNGINKLQTSSCKHSGPNSHRILKDLLISTHPLQIGEASKDNFWGVGLSLEYPNVLDADQWAPEGNLLGRTLMLLREELLAPSESHT